jgi:hypothetical protein
MKIVFQEIFEKNNWAPFEFKGKQISISDTISFAPGKVKLNITFEKINSNWEQGIFFKGKGMFFINKELLSDSFYLWHKTSPQTIEFIFDSKDGLLKIWNIWRVEDGPMQYGHNGAALYYDEIPKGKRYYCNDGYPDDDFDDLIFTIETNAFK